MPTSRSPGKTAVVCLHCGAKQLESVYAKSTICRKCSRHFEIRTDSDTSGSPQTPEAQESSRSFLEKFNTLLRREKVRTIRCLNCRSPQQVSSYATSSICPHCSSYLELKDFKVTTTYSRNINTQGLVFITPRGEVTGAKLACGEAVIQGKMNGNLVCTGTVRVKVKGRLSGGIDARHLIIEKGCDVEFVRAIKAHTVEIHGRISARVLSDVVSVVRTGTLEGTVYAKSFNVEKGGVFLGELYIGKQELDQPELPAAAPGKRTRSRPELGGSQPTLALA